MATWYTQFLRLAVPDFLVSPWHTTLADTFTQLDATVYNALVLGEFTTWANSHAYVVGNRVIDSVDGSMWLCLVSHTSIAPVNAMSVDRAAHATYWAGLAPAVRPRGAYANNTKYFVGDLVYDTSANVIAYCITLHTSFATGNIKANAGELATWAIVFDAGSGGAVAASGVSYDHSGTPSLVAVTVQAAIDEVVSDNTTLLAAKAPLASPTFTGTPAAPTAAGGTNTTQLATTQFVQTAIAGVRNGVAANLDTLVEIAASINNDPSYFTTVNTALALKAPLASPALTGNPTAPTPSPGDNDTSIATTAFVAAALSGLGVSHATMTFSPATGSITIPAGMTCARIQMWGGSGGGGAIGVSNDRAGGGGAGGYLEKFLSGLTPGQTFTWVKGAAGAAHAAGADSVLSSGTATITTLTAAKGAVGGSSGAIATDPGFGGAGGTATNGDINITGGAGSNGLPGSASYTPGGLGGVGVMNQGGIGDGAGQVGGIIITWFP